MSTPQKYEFIISRDGRVIVLVGELLMQINLKAGLDVLVLLVNEWYGADNIFIVNARRAKLLLDPEDHGNALYN